MRGGESEGALAFTTLDEPGLAQTTLKLHRAADGLLLPETGREPSHSTAAGG